VGVVTGITGWAVWLQRRLGAAVFPVDHPGLPRCAGWHKPEYPCDGKRGKHPACSWARDSTTDPRLITRALAGVLRNTAIDTRKSGLLVVDEDQPGAFTEYAASIGQEIPQTFTVSTAKGRHFYFRQPGEQLGNGVGALAGRGIDVRGTGYVVAPGSVHETGVIYTADDAGIPVAAIPGWLVTALRSPAPGARVQQPAGRRTGGSVPARLRGVIAVVLDARPPGPRGQPPGERNNALYWASCRAAEMVAAGELDQATAIRVLTEAGEATGLGPGAVAATIDSALRRVLA
jgi:hypothetical protein